MSENVATIRAMFESWNERRWDDFREGHDPDVAIMRFIDGWPESDPAVGRDAVMSFYEGMPSWGKDTVEPIGELAEAGGQVAARVRWRTSTQGQEVSMELTAVYAVRRGRVARIEFFREHADALEAIGLSE